MEHSGVTFEMNHAMVYPAVVVLTVIAPLILLAGCRQPSESLAQITNQNTEAMGGRAAIDSIQSIQVKLHIVDPGFEVDGTYRAMRPGMMRIDVTAGGKHVFTEAFNGHRGWQWKGEGDVEDEGPQATATLKHGVELPGKLFGLHEMSGRGHKLTMLSRETIDGINYHVVRLTFSDGYSTTLYIDPNTGLITRRRDFRPLHVDVDPTPTTIETMFSDFRVVQGVKFALASTDRDLKTGKVLETTQLTEILVNPVIDRSIFEAL